MNTEKLIAAVHLRSAIWDKNDKLHCSRYAVDKRWKEISAEMREEEFKLRKRWKYLRDQFAVELGKVQSPHFGDPGDYYKCKWPYLRQLMFLKDVIKPRKSTRNLSKVTNQIEELHEVSVEDQFPAEKEENEDWPRMPLQSEIPNEAVSDDSTDFVAHPSTSDSHISACQGRKGKTMVIDFNKAVLEKEKIMKRERREQLKNILDKFTLKQEKESVDDEHLNFFKSIIPHVKKIPEFKILTFRNRIQELVLQFADYHHSSSTPQSSSSTLTENLLTSS